MSMSESEAIRRLKDHFRVHDDGRPTPYLDKAVSMAIQALEKVQALEENKTYQIYREYLSIGTVSEFRESKNFLEFLYNVINPNEMEQYLAMYQASGRKGE